MSVQGLGPITGTFPPEGEDQEIKEIAPHEGFNQAWANALEQAAQEWHKEGDPRVEIPVTVEYRARIDIWNPGGIGQYHVIITPGG
jgi:hypothetical protein